MLKKLLYKLLLRLSPSLVLALTENQAKARTEWMLKSHDTEGFKAYYAARYYGILQSLANGVEKDHEYYINLGRRMELLHLLAELKQAFDADTKQRMAKK